MTNTTADDRRQSGRPPRPHARKRIKLPNGDELWPRAHLALRSSTSTRAPSCA